MPWDTTDIEAQRRRFIHVWLSGQETVTRLCQRFGISRKTAYKWIERFKAEGMNSLEDRSRAPRQQAFATPADKIQVILDLRLRFHWGGRKIAAHLKLFHGDETWPCASTIDNILDRHGLVTPRKRRHKAPARTAPLAHATAPNVVWSVDFKGDFLMGNGERCYPLTVFDNHSRLLLACQGLKSTRHQGVIPVFERLFREFGLPEFVRSDNGPPFASTRIGGVTTFSLWLLKRGVVPERIRPGKPQENGRHERFHRSLKAATCRPPKGNLAAQQRAFNRYRFEYNTLRPHESLDDQLPAAIYTHSPRLYTGEVSEAFSYPDHFLTRRVLPSGNIKWHRRAVYVANRLAGETIGLEPLDDGLWTVYLSTIKLGVFVERQLKIIRPGR